MKWIVAALIIWVVWKYLPRTRPSAVGDEAKARADARRVLGVGRDADDDAIRAAHRHLVASVHPDRGGSADLARRVNAARDLLLKRGG